MMKRSLAQHALAMTDAAKFYCRFKYPKPEQQKKHQELLKSFEELSKTLLLTEQQMARAAAAIDKLESRIDEQDAAIKARDRKIISLNTQLATAQQNTLDDADLADVARVEGQTFDPIPPVDNGTPADTTQGTGGNDTTTGTGGTDTTGGTPAAPATPATPAA